MNKDPVMVDLDRYLTESEEDYKSPEDIRIDREEWLADSMDWEE
jgi:hypothetical protein